MRKALKITLVLFIVILSKLLLSFILNEILIVNYNNGSYKKELLPILKLLNTNEPYIVYYNEGNILYTEGNYEDALTNYNIALNKRPSKARVCDIRINKTLTLIKLINSNKKEVILEKLKEARENLYENNCANPNDNSGESEEAEVLEEVIKEMEEEIENGEGESNSNNNNNNNSEEENGNESEEQNIEKELEEIRKNANGSRQSDLDFYESSSNYEYYSGKRW